MYGTHPGQMNGSVPDQTPNNPAVLLQADFDAVLPGRVTVINRAEPGSWLQEDLGGTGPYTAGTLAAELKANPDVAIVITNSEINDYTFSNPADYFTYRNLKNRTCPVQSTASVRFTHAQDYDGGYSAPLFATTSKLFQFIQGCSANSVPAGPGMCVSYQGCRTPLLECTYSGHVHAMPANSPQDIWDFIGQ